MNNDVLRQHVHSLVHYQAHAVDHQMLCGRMPMLHFTCTKAHRPRRRYGCIVTCIAMCRDMCRHRSHTHAPESCAVQSHCRGHLLVAERCCEAIKLLLQLANGAFERLDCILGRAVFQPVQASIQVAQCRIGCCGGLECVCTHTHGNQRTLHGA